MKVLLICYVSIVLVLIAILIFSSYKPDDRVPVSDGSTIETGTATADMETYSDMDTSTTLSGADVNAWKTVYRGSDGECLDQDTLEWGPCPSPNDVPARFVIDMDTVVLSDGETVDIVFSIDESEKRLSLDSTDECGAGNWTLPFLENYDIPGCRMVIKVSFLISCRQTDEHTISCESGDDKPTDGN